MPLAVRRPTRASASPLRLLINATGPHFAATAEGSARGESLSVCTAEHAVRPRVRSRSIERMAKVSDSASSSASATARAPARAPPSSTSSTSSSTARRGARARRPRLHHERRRTRRLRRRRHSHEARRLHHSESHFAESLFSERNIDSIPARRHKVEPGRSSTRHSTERTRGSSSTSRCSCLRSRVSALTPSTGMARHHRADVHAQRLHARRRRLPAEAVRRVARRRLAGTYRSPLYENVFAAGIAFAPPHPLSRPRKTPNGTGRAGAAAHRNAVGDHGTAVTLSIVDMIDGADGPTHGASMSEMGAACVASAGANPFSAAQPHDDVPGRPRLGALPGGRARPGAPSAKSAWRGTGSSILHHHMFLYKAGLAGWWLIPE